MSNRNILLVALIYLTSPVFALKSTSFNSNKDDLKYLKHYNGKYPSEIKLLSNLSLTKRLKPLLKEKFTFLKDTWAVETPIEIKDNVFIAWGCQQHNCSNTNFIIVVDFSKNIVYVGIRENENVKTYSEDGTTNKEIIKWATRI